MWRFVGNSVAFCSISQEIGLLSAGFCFWNIIPPAVIFFCLFRLCGMTSFNKAEQYKVDEPYSFPCLPLRQRRVFLFVLEAMLTEERVNELFRSLAALPFPNEKFEELIPEAVNAWKRIGETQSTPWQMVMYAELLLTSFQTATAVLEPEDSIRVRIFFFVLVLFFLVVASSTDLLFDLGLFLASGFHANLRLDSFVR